MQQPTLTPTMVESWVDRLGGAAGAGGMQVVENLIDAWTEQELAALDGHRDDRRAEANAIVGLAAEQVARYQPRYESDLTEVRRTRRTLDATLAALTGFQHEDTAQPHSLVPDRYPVESTLGHTIDPPLGPIVIVDETGEYEPAHSTMDPYAPHSYRSGWNAGASH